MKTNRFALRVLQNRTGLVPRPSWCTYRVRPEVDAAPMMDLEGVRQAFGKLGELDLVRLVGPEPLLRPDLVEVAEVILEQSRPSVLHVTTEGRAPEAAEDLARGFSEARRLRFLVCFPPVPDAEVPFTTHRRFALALETIKRLRPIARERQLEVAGLIEVDLHLRAADIARLRRVLGDLGVELHVSLPPLPPPALGFPQDAATDRWLEVIEAELEVAEHRRGGLASVGERYFLRGLRSRLRGDLEPRPQPKCTSLRSHVRLEPDGSVPTCGFFPERVGNLDAEAFDSVWFSEAAERGRGFVDACSGCWSADEVLPSALYTGDIVRGFRERGASAGGLRASATRRR